MILLFVVSAFIAVSSSLSSYNLSSNFTEAFLVGELCNVTSLDGLGIGFSDRHGQYVMHVSVYCRYLDGDFDTYITHMRQPHVWGGEPELLMASHVLK